MTHQRSTQTFSREVSLLCVVAALLPGLVKSAAFSSASIWPLPQQISIGTRDSYLAPTFYIRCASALCPEPLPRAFRRYRELSLVAGLPRDQTGSEDHISLLEVSVAESAPLVLGASENYSLSVPVSGVAVLTAQTQWGALRGLESFSQLFRWTGSSDSSYVVSGTPVEVRDWPRFPWRSILLDSSRHFLTVSAVKSTLDAMSYAKFNRLHWHVADNEAWPLVSQRYPALSQHGALSPDAVYSPADVADIVQYAFDRGISIYPEFDLPAHALAWSKGYPGLVLTCPGGQPLVDPRDVDGGIFDVVDGLLKEFLPVFRADFVHFGGDEVHSYRCWDTSPVVQAWAAQKGLKNSSDIRNFFQRQLQLVAKRNGASAVFWQEVYDGHNDLFEESVVDIWLDNERLAQVLRSGHRAVQSFGYYLDRQVPSGNQTHYFWQDTILDFFLHDPLLGSSLSPTEAGRALGLSMSMWGEQVDAGNIHSRMWPRALGGAGRAWGDAAFRDATAAVTLMERARCVLVQRGIGAGPLFADSPETHCPLPAHIAEQHEGLHWDEIRLRALARGGQTAGHVRTRHSLVESQGHLSTAVRVWTLAIVLAAGLVVSVAVRGRAALCRSRPKAPSARVSTV